LSSALRHEASRLERRRASRSCASLLSALRSHGRCLLRFL
jgi:hypothetical protein